VRQTYSDALAEFRNPSFDRIEGEASALIKGEGAHQDISGNDVKFTTKKSLLGYDKMDKIGPYNCRMVDMTGLEFSLINFKPHKKENSEGDKTAKLPTYDEYFSGSSDWKETSIKGKDSSDKDKDKEEDKDTITETKKEVSASLWLSDEFPLPISSLVQILEIVSPASDHISKLKEILSVKLPPGFPVKMVLPIVTQINAAITFSKFHIMEGKSGTGDSVMSTSEPVSSSETVFSSPPEDVVTDELFKIPSSFQQT